MIDRNDDLPMSRQAKVLGISRGSVYYLPRPVSADDLALMRRIDELHLDYPFAGQPDASDFSGPRGIRCRAPPHRQADEADGGRGDLSPAQHVQTCAGAHDLPVSPAQAAGDAAQSGLGDGYHVYPNGAGLRLSCGRRRPVQPEGSGMEVIDYAGNGVLSRGGRGALARYGKPEIFNTDQGSQFTSIAFTGLLLKNEIKISMDGKGAWRDNVFVERLWRTIKYEEVYLRAYASVPEARASIGRYIDGFYNTRRPHSSLDRRTPDEAYFAALQPIPVAA